jgi:acyl-CoA thioesterase
MKDVVTYIRTRDELGKVLGVELLSAKDGSAKGQMVIAKQHLNGLEMTHGGSIFAFCDIIFAAASNSRPGTAVAINVNIAYFKTTKLGDTLFAEASEVSLTRKIGTYLVQVTDQNGEAVASFQGTVYRKEDEPY